MALLSPALPLLRREEVELQTEELLSAFLTSLFVAVAEHLVAFCVFVVARHLELSAFCAPAVMVQRMVPTALDALDGGVTTAVLMIRFALSRLASATALAQQLKIFFAIGLDSHLTIRSAIARSA